MFPLLDGACAAACHDGCLTDPPSKNDCIVIYRHTEQQETGRVNAPLHGYQKRLLVYVGKGGNHIIVAPTVSGKTRIAVELAGLVLGRKPTARILFLTQTVALAEQQTGMPSAVL